MTHPIGKGIFPNLDSYDLHSWYRVITGSKYHWPSNFLKCIRDPAYP